MFEPAHFLALYLPQYFSSSIAPQSSPNSLLSTLSHLKNFITNTIKLYHSFDDPIHLLSFLNTNFSLQLEQSSQISPVPTHSTLLNIILKSESGSNIQIVKLTSQILAFLFYLHVHCSKKNVSKELEEAFVSKFLTLSQKLRFQLEISKISMGEIQSSYDEILDQIFKLSSDLKGNVSAKRLMKKIFAHETFNVSELARKNIISGIIQLESSTIFNSSLQIQKTTAKKQDITEKPQPLPQKSVLNEKLKQILIQKNKEKNGREKQEAKKRIEQYSRLKKVKQIHKTSGMAGKDRTIYHMRKGKFVPKQGFPLLRTQSYCETFDFSTQMSSRSIQDYNRIQSERFPSQCSQYDSEMGNESDEQILVPETPRVGKRVETEQIVSRKLNFLEL